MRTCPRCLSIFHSDVEHCGLDGERVIETDKDPLIGKTIDRYRIMERLGHGGMSAVYRARHEVLGHERAIKFPYAEIAADRQLAERIRREAQAIAKIEHENVVRVFDFGTTPEGLNFLVMELLQGRPLNRAILQDGPFPPARAARIVKQVALGLSEAHRVGFVHRDLKPGNVMLSGEGAGEVAKILDFGLVRVTRMETDSDAMQGKLTKTGVTMGTPFYMAPEQMRGDEATPRSDLYSLGAVLYEMLSGSPPYRGSLPEIIVRQATEAPPPLERAAGLEKLAVQLLEKDPAKRPENAEAVAKAIERLDIGDDAPAARGFREAETRQEGIRVRERAPISGAVIAWKVRRWILRAAVLGLLIFGVVTFVNSRKQLEKRAQTMTKALGELDKKIVNTVAEASAPPQPQPAPEPEPQPPPEPVPVPVPVPVKEEPPPTEIKSKPAPVVAVKQSTPVRALPQKKEPDLNCSTHSARPRLEVVSRVLQGAKKTVTPKKIVGFEKRSRALRDAVDRRGLGQVECQTLMRRVFELERDVSNAVKANGSRG